MNQTVRIIGYGLIGLLLGGLFLVAVLAAVTGEPWLGRNYWNASISTWAILSTFGAVGILLAVKGLLFAWRRWRERS